MIFPPVSFGGSINDSLMLSKMIIRLIYRVQGWQEGIEIAVV